MQVKVFLTFGRMHTTGARTKKITTNSSTSNTLNLDPTSTAITMQQKAATRQNYTNLCYKTATLST